MALPVIIQRPTTLTRACVVSCKQGRPSPVEVCQLQGALQGALQVHAGCQLMRPLEPAGLQSVLEQLQQGPVRIRLITQHLLLQLLCFLWVSLQSGNLKFFWRMDPLQPCRLVP